LIENDVFVRIGDSIFCPDVLFASQPPVNPFSGRRYIPVFPGCSPVPHAWNAYSTEVDAAKHPHQWISIIQPHHD
jgi:hypothetical protein